MNRPQLPQLQTQYHQVSYKDLIINFGKYDYNVCTFLNWKVLRKEMSSHLNITCSAKFVCVHLGGGVWVPLYSI